MAFSSDLSRYDNDMLHIFQRVIKLPHVQIKFRTKLIKSVDFQQKWLIGLMHWKHWNIQKGKFYRKRKVDFFPIATVPHYPKPHGLKQHKITILHFWSSEIWYRSYEAKIKLFYFPSAQCLPQFIDPKRRWLNDWTNEL